ncbi:hypothetical protein AB0454_35580 [Streptomyces sp. NPDC093509]|uniref:hypothetical protein n=1 Tax=Streptomyces sp. NPDC093509 TaxID=3154982 RepID=UPI00344F8E9E
MSNHDVTLLGLGTTLGMYLLLLSDLVLGAREDNRRRAARAAALNTPTPEGNPMSRPSRAEMRELAEDREKCAARSASNAESARVAAADTTLPEAVRQRAAVMVPIALGHAAEYREEAEALRAGRIPGED